MFVLALVPPLWFAVMNPRVRAFFGISSSVSPKRDSFAELCGNRWIRLRHLPRRHALG